MKFSPPAWLRPESCPGLWTELNSLPADSVISVGAHDIVCVSTPVRPDFWVGNYLLFDPARDLSFYPSLCEEWCLQFGAMAGVGRVCFTTEFSLAQASPWQHFVPEGGLIEVADVLALQVFCPAPAPAEDFPYRIAPVESAADFEKVIEAAEDMDFADGGSAPWDFTVWRMREYWRSVCEQPDAVWWAAWDGAEVVAYAGLFRDNGMVSVQEVGTCPAYRRQGISLRLCSAMLRAALAVPGVRQCIQVAEPGGAGERVYQRLGFAPVNAMLSLVLPLA
jgi:GNAT superfamily N-acetyltransferase